MTVAAASTNREGSAGDVFAGTPYRVVRKLGEGGMGEVFLVVHEAIRRELVAKILHPHLATEAQLLERVRVEAQSLARLQDPNIVQITDFRRLADGRPFLVMERLNGRTLHEELAVRRTLPLRDALDFVHQALSGLSAAHALGIVHRDIKPENLFLCEELDKTITVKVLDFGVARVIPGISSEAPQPLALPTRTGAVIGTPRYLSPEAALGKRVDQRSDLYSVALVFYEMVAGRGPFDHIGNDLAAPLIEDPEPPSAFAKEPVPVEVDAMILRALSKELEDRYQTAEQFQRDIEEVWSLLQSSQAFQTTLFSVGDGLSRSVSLRVRKQASNAVEEVERGPQGTVVMAPQPSAPAPEQAPSSRESPHRSSLVEPQPAAKQKAALISASILVALVTAVAFTSLIAFLVARAP